MHRRRLLLSAAAAALAPVMTRAQTTGPAGCAIGFVNGLLQIDPECPLLTIPGTGMAIAPPSHLALGTTDETTTATTATTTVTDDELSERAARRQLRRERQDARRERIRVRKQARQDVNQERQRAKNEHRRTRKARRRAQRSPDVRCSEFQYQEDAQEFFFNSEYDYVNDPDNLNPDGDDKACENLPKKPATVEAPAGAGAG